MLDLDSLAEQQAQAVNEDVSDWRSALWAEEFQFLSQNMTDGEVESLISLCPSAQRFRDVVQFLGQKSGESGTPPFSILEDEALRAGVSPSEWVRKSVGR